MNVSFTMIFFLSVGIFRGGRNRPKIMLSSFIDQTFHLVSTLRKLFFTFLKIVPLVRKNYKIFRKNGKFYCDYVI